MFLQNKYTKWYYSIIESAQSRDNNVYVEKHHIIPKSLGGSNSKDNIVSLTAREHYLCHLLLVKMTEGEDKMKMAFALNMMVNLENEFQQRFKVNSHYYQYIKNIVSIEKSKWMLENNPFRGKKHSAKTLAVMSQKRAERYAAGIKEGMSGKKHSEATKQKIRESLARKRASMTEEERKEKYNSYKNGRRLK